MKAVKILLFFVFVMRYAEAWTTEDMEMYVLVQNIPQNFYDVLGVDQKASTSDIRKAFRKLSLQYHPDKNQNSNAEETFRMIVTVATVLRNDEKRKKYDLIMESIGPVYYYSPVQNIGLFVWIILLGIATIAQYLLLWLSYWNKKNDIEVALLQIRKKAKNERMKEKLSGKKLNERKHKREEIDVDAFESEVMTILQKPSCQDLFPIRLLCFFLHLIKLCLACMQTIYKDYIKFPRSAPEKKLKHEFQRTKSQEAANKNSRKIVNGSCANGAVISAMSNNSAGNNDSNSENLWTQEEQHSLELALQLYPKYTRARWDKIGSFMSTKSKEDCLKRCKILAQSIKRKELAQSIKRKELAQSIKRKEAKSI